VDTPLQWITPRNRTRIDVAQPSELRWWCHRLNQTEEGLRAAVIAAGPLSTEVLFYLNNKRERDQRLPESEAAKTTPPVVRGDLRRAAVRHL
jgi:hypothetical protein